MDQIPGLRILDDCHENRKMMEKLPKWARREWARKIEDYSSKLYRKFSEFAHFVVKLADRVNNPIFLDTEKYSPSTSTPTKIKGLMKQEHFKLVLVTLQVYQRNRS